MCSLDVMVEVAGGKIGWTSVGKSEVEERAETSSCAECCVAGIVDASIVALGSIILGFMTVDNSSLSPAFRD